MSCTSFLIKCLKKPAERFMLECIDVLCHLRSLSCNCGENHHAVHCLIFSLTQKKETLTRVQICYDDEATKDKKTCENISLHGVKAQTANPISFKASMFCFINQSNRECQNDRSKNVAKKNKTIIHL